MAVINGNTPTITGTADADILVGSGSQASRTFSAGDGNDVVFGDRFRGFEDAVNSNGSMATALSIDNFNFWGFDPGLDSLDRNHPDVGTAPGVPYTTVLATGAGNDDWFSVTVGAGETITLDIDYGRASGGGPLGGGSVDTVLTLFDSAGVLINMNDDIDFADSGSDSAIDAALSQTVTTEGTYFIRVSDTAFDPYDVGDTYVLQASVTNHSTTGAFGRSNDSITGGSGDDVLHGLSGSDVIDGGTGNNSIHGGNLDDTIIANGDGGDTLDGGSGTDLLDYSAATADIALNLVTGATGITDEIAVNFENVITGDGNDTVTGTDDANAIDTGVGDDTVIAGGGNDVIIDAVFSLSGSDTDSYDGGDGIDTLVIDVNTNAAEIINLASGETTFSGTVIDRHENIENVEIGGGGQVIGDGEDNIISSIETSTLQQDNTFRGGLGNDTIDGGLGADSLEGGGGIDTISYARDTVGVQVDLASGFANGGEATGDTHIGFENFIGGSGNDIVVGADGVDNTLEGGEGNDTLVFTTGDDLYDGGAGFDTLDMSAETVGHFVDLNGRQIDDTFPATQSIERVIAGSGADTLEGGSTDVTLEGRSGNDEFIVSGFMLTGLATLLGGEGGDTFKLRSGTTVAQGETGDDTFVLDESGVHQVFGGDGNDTVIIADDDAFDSFDQDVLDGGDDIDTLDFSNLGDPLFGSRGSLVVDLGAETAGFSARFRRETVSDFENVIGSTFRDRVTGNELTNVISGGSNRDTLRGVGGDDSLTGGADGDTIDGGDGVDTALYTDSALAVTVDLVAGTGTGGDAEGDVLIDIENLGGSAGNDILTGNEFDNTIRGEDGDDTIRGGNGQDSLRGSDGIDLLIGGSGNDNLNGGDGDDRLRGNSGVDTVAGGDGADRIDGASGGDLLRGGNGNDTIEGEGGNDVLNGQNDDDIVRGGGGLDIVTGAGGNDRVEGNAGADIVNGNAGNDSVTGGGGGDFVSGGADNDFVNGNSGNDTVNGDDGNDTLIGGSGDDTLDGGTGVDFLSGDAGDDILTGGADNDTFQFGNNFDADTITDFLNNRDTLAVDDNLYNGTLTASQIVDTFATDISGGVVFDFGGGDIVTVMGVSSAEIANDILIV